MRCFPLILLGLLCAVGSAEEVKLPAVADVWVSSYRGEVNYNVGVGNQLKLKGIQEMSIIRFDPAKLKGRRILGGHLFLKESGKKNALRKIGLSTVSSSWVEGQAVRYARDDTGHGATFREASYNKRPWAWQGSDLSDVTMGNGNTLQHHTELVRTGGGWVKVDVPDYLIQAMAAGATDGLLVMDHSGQTTANNYVFSRHVEGAEPYLVVRLGAADSARPDSPRLKLEPAPDRATLSSGAVTLWVRPPAGAFSYDIKVNGMPLDRWRIPFPPGIGEPITIGLWKIPPMAKMKDGWQKIILEELPPGAAINVEVRAVSPTGIAGEWSTMRGRTSAALSSPGRLRLAKSKMAAGDPPVHRGRIRVWAFPETVKIDPEGGKASAALRRASHVWSGANGTITLSAARGEVVAFQLCVEASGGRLEGVRIVPAGLISLAGGAHKAIDRNRIDLYRVWYVKAGGAWQGEYAIPIRHGQGVAIPWAKNRIDGQKNQTFYVDIFVPKDAAPGGYEGSISISARGVPAVKLPVRLTVHDFVLPDEMNFYADLNCYTTPGAVGSERFRASHRLAHAHRCTIVTVPYRHAGTVRAGTAPPLTGEGAGRRVGDWSAFDRGLGPLFDGSLFEGCPRDGVPVNVFILPLHENWPTPMAGHYSYRGPQRGKGIMRPFALNSKPIHKAFSREHQAAFRAVAKGFAEHAKKRGWTRTKFKCFFNNKWYYRADVRGRGTYGTSWWCLDEPDCFDDFEAIIFLGHLFKQGVRDVRGVQFILRADISRPRWQRNWMTGLMDWVCVSGAMYYKPRRCELLRRNTPSVQIKYGACNAIEDPNLISLLWCYEGYLLGADGVLPWQSLGGDSAFDAPNRNGLVVDGTRRFGVRAVASLRVKALRRGVQDVEYLITMAKKRGWTREQVRFLLTGAGDYRGAVDRVKRWTLEDVAAVREAVAALVAGRRR